MISSIFDNIPVVGHIKGGFHYLDGDSEACAKSMKKATRTAVVMVNGTTGFMIGGPLGGMVGGVVGGASMDFAITMVSNDPKGYGLIKNAKKIYENPYDGSEWWEAGITITVDAMTGYATGWAVNKLLNKPIPSTAFKESTNLARNLKGGASGSMGVASYESSTTLNQSNQLDTSSNQSNQLDKYSPIKYGVCKEIRTSSSIKRGEVILRKIQNSPFYHYGINIGDRKVIDLNATDANSKNSSTNRKSDISIVSLEKFSNGQKVQIQTFESDRRSLEETAKQAEYFYNNKKGWKLYNVFSCNCEHFTNACATGIAYSTQSGLYKQ